MDECEEPKCTRPVTKNWNGRKVCDDCYDKYRTAQEEIYMDLD